MKLWSYTRSFLAVLAFCCGAHAQPVASGPQDQPRGIPPAEIAKLEIAIAPYIANARETYPAARSRFLKGLPPDQRFFIVTRIYDSQGRWEQVFVRVQSIHDGLVTGLVASQLNLVKKPQTGESYTFKESDLIDWVISRRDGTEEGNVVGKFLDTYTP